MSSFKEGLVVLITGKLDNRIRDTEAAEAIGTLFHLDKDEVRVILGNGNFWYGKKWEIAHLDDQEEVLEDWRGVDLDDDEDEDF